MKVHVSCTSQDEAEQTVAKKVQDLGHELVESGSEADVVLVIVTMNNYRSAMNWVPVLWDISPTTPVAFVESDYPNRIFGSLEAECSPVQLQKALESMVK